ncbi:hypothetical protein X777_08344 [Ooceraea biroi]|uniref:Uncharacterized protein n=1 Tax=Ooceraea biroi TaxID=2015173 RepID=A0A026WYP8_OOCBI|nr:hypothetical protein X777_08344 [Ooceraea biroi]
MAGDVRANVRTCTPCYLCAVRARCRKYKRILFKFLKSPAFCTGDACESTFQERSRSSSVSWRMTTASTFAWSILLRIIDVRNILEALINVWCEDVREGWRYVLLCGRGLGSHETMIVNVNGRRHLAVGAGGGKRTRRQAVMGGRARAGVERVVGGRARPVVIAFELEITFRTAKCRFSPPSPSARVKPKILEMPRSRRYVDTRLSHEFYPSRFFTSARKKKHARSTKFDANEEQ